VYGDFSRLTFEPRKHYSSVWYQQGRVSLDANPNEQNEILLHYMRTLAADLIGPHGGPQSGAGFGIQVVADAAGQLEDLRIGPGRYYVDGLLVENEALDEGGAALEVTYRGQPHAYLDQERATDRLPPGFPFLLYMRVSEQLVTGLEDRDLLEVALGSNGPDTAARTKVVWQIRATDKLPDGTDLPNGADANDIAAAWDDWVKLWQPDNRGRLRARARRPADAESDVCIVSPEARYRGHENQLYRVEVHTGGPAATATFKWSRENGSVAQAIEELNGRELVLASLGRDGRLGLSIGDAVEVVDDAYTLRGEVAPLRRVVDLDPVERRVTLDEAPTGATGRNPALHPLLRRWDQIVDDQPKSPGGLKRAPDNAAAIVEAPAAATSGWLRLEDGIEVHFQDGGVYRPGDYWLIPARTETGDVEWPGPASAPFARPPHGIRYHFAPLALIRAPDDTQNLDLRRLFAPLP
jgi:hypothetical protein